MMDIGKLRKFIVFSKIKSRFSEIKIPKSSFLRRAGNFPSCFVVEISALNYFDLLSQNLGFALDWLASRFRLQNIQANTVKNYQPNSGENPPGKLYNELGNEEI